MLDSLNKRSGNLRWPPRQRFGVTDLGRAALTAYNESLDQYHAREQRDRSDLDRVQRNWADSYRVDPNDASVLNEFDTKKLLPREVQVSLDCCGTTLKEVQAAVDRLYLAGLIAPVGGGGPVQPGSPDARAR